MGLDVYLYKLDRSPSDAAKARADGEALAASYDASHPIDWTEANDEEKAAWFALRNAWLAERKLNDGFEPDAMETRVKHNSAVYPEHMFKIGYLRSSYNDSGVNRILRDRIGKDLAYIFGQSGEYIVTPDWPACLRRAREVRDEFASYVDTRGAYMVLFEAPNIFASRDKLPTSAGDVLARFFKHIAEDPRRANGEGPFTSYACGGASYFFGADTLDVVAAFPGLGEFDQVGVYLVLKVKPTPDDGGKPFGWYRRATEIVVEMCEWVLSQPDPERHILHWSG